MNGDAVQVHFAYCIIRPVRGALQGVEAAAQAPSQARNRHAWRNQPRSPLDQTRVGFGFEGEPAAITPPARPSQGV